MAEKKAVLQMNFTSPEGKSVSLSLADPREDLTAAEVETAMNLLNDLRVLVKINGTNLLPAKLKGAKTVETLTNDFDITVA